MDLARGAWIDYRGLRCGVGMAEMEKEMIKTVAECDKCGVEGIMKREGDTFQLPGGWIHVERNDGAHAKMLLCGECDAHLTGWFMEDWDIVHDDAGGRYLRRVGPGSDDVGEDPDDVQDDTVNENPEEQ